MALGAARSYTARDGWPDPHMAVRWQNGDQGQLAVKVGERLEG